MRVMMLFKSDAKTEAGVPPSQELRAAMSKYSKELVSAGVLAGGEGLQPSSKGAKVRIANGKTTVMDGPFAESKEVVAGYFMLDTKSLAEAIDWAKRLPVGDWVSDDHVELRPVYETADFPMDATEQPGGWRDQEIEMRNTPQAAPGPEKGARWVSFLMADKNTEAAMQPTPKLLEEMGALIQEMADKGILIAGEGLKPTSDSARVHISADRKIRVIDGPFAEAKEVIAGFSMFRAKSKAEAVEWARRCLQIHMNCTGIDTGEAEVFQVVD